MVTILPTKKNLGSYIGEQLGSGLSQGMNESIDYNLRRSRLAEAMKPLENLTQEEIQGKSPYELSAMAAKALLPYDPSGRVLSTLLPAIMNRQQADRIFGEGGQQTGGISTPNNPMAQGSISNLQEKDAMLKASPAIEGKEGFPQPQEPKTGGFLPEIMTPEEMQQRVAQAARNDPSQAAYWQQFYQNQNTAAENQYAKAEDLLKSNGVAPDEVAEAMNIGKRYGYMKDPNDWLRATKRDYKEYKNNVTQLNDAFIPSFFTGLTKGPKPRETALKTLTGPVNQLIKLGREQEVRPQLAQMGLSPTEIEEVIHPMPDRFNNTLKTLPKGPFSEEQMTPGKYDLGELIETGRNKQKPQFKSYDELSKESPQEIEKLNNILSNFLKKNLTKDMSLSVLRHKLVKEKGYDWRQFGPALDKAVADGLELSEAQNGELTEVYNKAPRDSLSEIFTDWDRPYRYFKGEK